MKPPSLPSPTERTCMCSSKTSDLSPTMRRGNCDGRLLSVHSSTLKVWRHHRFSRVTRSFWSSINGRTLSSQHFTVPPEKCDGKRCEMKRRDGELHSFMLQAGLAPVS